LQGIEDPEEAVVASMQLTQAQVFCGLQDIWEDATGTDEPFELDTQIYAYMKADGSWDELDLADIFLRLEEFFGFTCERQDWRDLFGFEGQDREQWERRVAPRLTFRVLADFIAARAPIATSFEPIILFGRPCAPAGIFLGLQQVACSATSKSLHTGPSTRIIDVLRGDELDRFWRQVRWMTEHSIPKLPAFWRDVTGLSVCMSLLLTLGGLFIAWGTSKPQWILPILFGAAVIIPLSWVYKRLANPLPSYVVSFRDLSELIARNWKALPNCSFKGSQAASQS
jgi:hypothetical protein